MLWTSWVTARHEVRRLLSERSMIVFGLLLPVIIITLVGLTFGGTGKVDIGVRDLDGSARSRALIERLDHRKGVELRTYHSDGALRRDVRTTDQQAGLVIPAGYGEAVDAGKGQVDIVIDPKSQSAFSAIATIDAAATLEGVQEGAARVVAAAEGTSGAAARTRIEAAGSDLRPVQVVDRHTVGRKVAGGTFSYTAPSNLVLFVFVNTFAVSTILAWDRKNGLIKRQLSTPNSPTAILVGLGVSKLAFSLLQTALILTIGALGFGVHWGDPVAIVVLCTAFSSLATAVGLLVGSIAADADQAQSVGIPLAIAAAMLGGCMWPLSIVPRAMQVVGHVAPHAWAMDAWQELIYDKANVVDILPNLAVIGGMALVIGLLAVRALRRSVFA
jgi:ABC-2 type transport system permease protein